MSLLTISISEDLLHSYFFIAIYLGLLGGILADELNLGGSIALELVIITLGHLHCTLHTLEFGK